MESNDKDKKENKNESNNRETKDFSEYNIDDILQDSKALLRTKSLNESEEKKQEQEQEPMINRRFSLRIKSSGSNEIKKFEEEIITKFLSNPIDFVNCLEYLLPQEKIKSKKILFF